MIYSNKRKLCLSGWLRQNSRTEYDTPLKLQMFLLLYEAFSKTAGERDAFNKAAEENYNAKREEINEDRAKKCAFVVKTLSENELSELTHAMNLWKSKESRIMSGEYQVDLEEEDFNESDYNIISSLDKMYPMSLIENSCVIDIDNHYFVFSKSDAQKLTEHHFDTLSTLAENEELHNPIYVDIDEEGRLIVD